MLAVCSGLLWVSSFFAATLAAVAVEGVVFADTELTPPKRGSLMRFSSLSGDAGSGLAALLGPFAEPRSSSAESLELGFLLGVFRDPLENKSSSSESAAVGFAFGATWVCDPLEKRSSSSPESVAFGLGLGALLEGILVWDPLEKMSSSSSASSETWVGGRLDQTSSTGDRNGSWPPMYHNSCHQI